MGKKPNSGQASENKKPLGVAFDPIAAALRQMHDKVSQEDIPDDFLRLLDEIDERAAKGKA